MSDKKVIRLNAIGKQIAKQCIEQAPDEYICTIQKKTRSLDQNAKLHSMLTDISKQVIWHGQKFSMETWKRLCVAAWLREKNERPLLVPALDGAGVDIIYEKTSKLNVSECAELIEWCYAFGAQNGVKFKETRYEDCRLREVEFVA